jgi:TonB family protein
MEIAMKFSVLCFAAVIFMGTTTAYAENLPIGAKVERGGPELRKACGIADIEASQLTDMQKFKAIYKKYDEREDLVLNKQTCSIELGLSALEWGKKVFPENSKNLANLAYNYAVTYREGGLGIGKEVMIYAVERFEAAFGRESAEILPVYEDACIAGIEDKANPKDFYCTRAAKLSAKTNGTDSLEYAATILNVSTVMLANSKYYWGDTKDLLLIARDIYAEHSMDKDLSMARVNFSLGKLQASLDHHKNAIEYYQQALSILEQPSFEFNRLTLFVHAFMVESLEALGQKDEATKHCLIIARLAPSLDGKTMQPLFQLAPKYPANAVKNSVQGDVNVEFVVDESGYVKNPKIKSSSVNDKILEEASLETVKKYRYAPRFVDGKAVATEGVTQSFSFKILR